MKITPQVLRDYSLTVAAVVGMGWAGYLQVFGDPQTREQAHHMTLHYGQSPDDFAYLEIPRGKMMVEYYDADGCIALTLNGRTFFIIGLRR